MRPLLKPGHAAPVHATPGAHANGFDYPTQLVGTGKWKGADGKGITVYYDPSTGQQGLAAAQHVLAGIDDLMASNDWAFGFKGSGGNVIVAPDFGGAYHYGCSFSSGGDWYCSVGDPQVVFGLAQAEITESYMGAAIGWNCGGSGGESLSRVMAEWVTGGAGGALVDYASGPSWDGTDWISKDQGTDQDYPSIGCGVLYLWWMLKTHTLDKIVQAGEPDGTLASNWAKLTGQDKSLAFAAFKAAVGSPPASSDNPFGTPNPAYPAGGTPVPPTPPPTPPPVPPTPPPAPPPTPTPVPSGNFNLQLSADCGPNHQGLRFTYTITPLKNADHVEQVLDAFDAARPGFRAATPSDVWAQIKAWLQKEESIVAGVVVADLPEVFLGLKTWQQVLSDVEAAVAAGGFPALP